MKNSHLSFTDKRSAREFFSSERGSISHSLREEYEKALCYGIETLDEYKIADTLLLYFPTKSEPDLRPLARRALLDGKKIAFPISNTDNCTLSFKEINELDELSVGAYGIHEPPARSTPACLTDRTLCVIPALAVDAQGYRLGYGKGYYDRFLADFKGVTVCAVFSALVCKDMPRLDTDVPVKIIVTERGAIRNK